MSIVVVVKYLLHVVTAKFSNGDEEIRQIAEYMFKHGGYVPRHPLTKKLVIMSRPIGHVICQLVVSASDNCSQPRKITTTEKFALNIFSNLLELFYS